MSAFRARGCLLGLLRDTKVAQGIHIKMSLYNEKFMWTGEHFPRHGIAGVVQLFSRNSIQAYCIRMPIVLISNHRETQGIPELQMFADLLLMLATVWGVMVAWSIIASDIS